MQVIKVEPLAGDQVRAMSHGLSSTFAIVNRNKRSVALDAKTTEGKKLITKLVAGADVFVQNFRPGAIERMGLGYSELSAIRPDLIYVSISGFGESGATPNLTDRGPKTTSSQGLTPTNGFTTL